MSLVLIPITSQGGETATAYSQSIGDYIEGQDGLTIDNLLELSETNGLETTREDIEAMSPEERYLFLLEDVGYYNFDLLAVVDSKHLDNLEEMSNTALDHGTDSALYTACGNYCKAVEMIAEKVIPFYGDHVVPYDY